MRKQIAAANWKMNLSLQEGEALADNILSNIVSLPENHQVVFGVPFPYLQAINGKLNGNKSVAVSAQNIADKTSGAYTGETSATMLKSIGVNTAIIGHSERREYYHETNKILADKLNIALANNITPIFCCGESLSIREANTQNDYVANQLLESLFHLDSTEILKVVIAYEPIWAIGTGKTASSAEAQEMHAHIRKVLTDKYGSEISDEISILYGGSVKAANASEIFGQPDVDGGLVGGASLVADEFSAIIKSLKN